MKLFRRLLVPALVAFAAACGGGDDDDSSTPLDASTNDATGNGDAGGSDSATADAGFDAGPPKPLYDWVGVIGAGQGISIGLSAPAISTTQPFHNLRLVDTGPDPKYPIFPDAGAPVWATALLIEPIRATVSATPDSGTTGYGDGQYPDDIFGETPHSGMANALTALWAARGNAGEYVSAHTAVGVAGQCFAYINKAGGKRAYPASLQETRVYKSLADAAGKSYGVGGIILMNGECDAFRPDYASNLYQYWQDYDADLKAITGQSRDPVIFVSQQSTVVGNGATGSAVQAWQASLDHPAQIVLTGPKYQYTYIPSTLDIGSGDHVRLGEKFAEVFDQVVNQNAGWKPLQPKSVTRAGAVITIAFDVPNPPLVFDSHMPNPHATNNTQWANGKGFEVLNGTTKLNIVSADVSGSSVVLTLSSDPGSAIKVAVGYALTKDGADIAGGTSLGLIGSLRDSDSYVGWDEETITANVTNGSAVVTAAAGAFARRSPRDLVTSSTAGIAADTVVASQDSDAQLTLSAPWSGATGTAMLTLRHDEYNYCVHFSMVEP